LNSITLNSAVSPFANLVPSSFSSKRPGAKASASSPSKTTIAPLAFVSLIVPV